MTNYHIPLVPGGQYHVFSRAVGDEKVFRDPRNYLFFLERYYDHISPVADTYCFCLLPNHFHCLIRIKDEQTIQKYFEEIKKDKTFQSDLASDFIMERFSNLLNSYVKSLNKVYGRKGGLFMDYMRRVLIESEAQFLHTTFYIHNNPVHHNYCNDLREWIWSSFNQIVGGSVTALLREELLKEFGGLDRFIEYHNQVRVADFE